MNGYSKLSKLKNKTGKIIYNPNKNTRTTVSILLRGSCQSCDKQKPGYYVAKLSKGSNEMVLHGSAINTTVNRMLISGLIEAISKLKYPCEIHLYTHTNIGFSGGSTNADIKNELFELIRKNNHSIVEIISDKYQDKLKELHIKNLKNIS